MSQWADLNCRPLPYQGNALPLSYIGVGYKIKSGRPGSNRRHSAWKADALPTELLPQYFLSYQFNVGRAGFEPAKLKNNRFTVCPRWPLEYLPYYKDRSPLNGEKFKEPMEGLEPTTCWLQISCSSQLSYIGLCSCLRTVANVTINLVGFKKIKRHFNKKVIAFL